ncbi:DUF4350 domain-containing protein [Halorubrum laminariae]|uniref:DUF4350 domain-containing protein n=1 Tax=Halorubrum laminariae TaxID=1433523 RepID=A0ABD6C0J2_9EURY|nr:DUF4350 domain-containing protein [Halorubrum laminariae]
MQTPSLPRVVLYALTIVLVGTLIFAASTTTATFGAYNVDWDGTSEFRTLAGDHTDSQVVLDVATYDTRDANDTVAIILAPEESYSENESQRIRRFVERGGTLVVADDFGQTGNALLRDIGATARFAGTPLRDERHYYQAPSLPIATSVTESPYTANVTQLTLNGATAVEPGSATTLATSSEFAYLDRNRTGNLSPTDDLGQYPVMTTEPVGAGEVVAVSDPSVFINTMLAQPDNRALAIALFETHDRTLLDYSKAGGQPPLAIVLLLFRSSLVAQVTTALVGSGLLWWYLQSRRHSTDSHEWLETILPPVLYTRLPFWIRGPSTGRHETVVDETAVMASLQNTYPELEDAQLRRMMTDFLSEQSREEEDE